MFLNQFSPKYFIYFLSLLFAAGCAMTTSNYIGNTYPPTTHCDVYFAKGDIKEPYTVMGRLIMDADPGTTSEKLTQKIVQIAESKGADGVFIASFRKVNVGADTSYDNFDQGVIYDGFGWNDVGMGGFYEGFGPGMATTEYIQDLRIVAFFLKYKE